MKLIKHKGNTDKYVCPDCKHPMMVYTSKEIRLGGILMESDHEYWL